jgi:hypothetical protein
MIDEYTDLSKSSAYFATSANDEMALSKYPGLPEKHFDT